jgi:hypothetical protein
MTIDSPEMPLESEKFTHDILQCVFFDEIIMKWSTFIIKRIL